MDVVTLDVSLPRCGVYCGSWNEIQIRIFFKTWVHFVAVIPETPNAISTRCPIWYRRDRDSWLSFVAWIRLQCAGSNSASLARSIDMSPRGGISSSFTMNYSLLSPLSLPVRSSITCWRCVCDENQTLNDALRRRALMLLPFELQIKCADWTRLRRHRHFNAQLHSFNCFLNVHLILAMENHLCLNAENLSLSKHTICQ